MSTFACSRCEWCGGVTSTSALYGLCMACYHVRLRLYGIRAQMDEGERSEWGDRMRYNPARLQPGNADNEFDMRIYPFYRHVVLKGLPAADYIADLRHVEDEGDEDQDQDQGEGSAA